jgi:hypothetical protein
MTNKKYTVLAGLAFAIVVCSAATSPYNDYKNLKVVPRDISPGALQRIMVDEFDDGLGVGCGFCHAKQKGSERLDYTSDAKPEKEIARRMMRMTLKVNRKYFQVAHPRIGDSTIVVTCQTCHRGEAHPAP